MQQSAGWDVPVFSGNTLHEHFSLDSTSGSEYEGTKTACKKWKRCFTPWNFEQADHWWLRRICSEENFWHAWSTSAAFSLHHRRKHKQSRRRVKGSTPESISCQHMHRNAHTHTHEHVFVYPSRGHALKLCSSCSFSAPHSRNNIWSYVCQPTRSISLNSIINITYSSGVSMRGTAHAGWLCH